MLSMDSVFVYSKLC